MYLCKQIYPGWIFAHPGRDGLNPDWLWELNIVQLLDNCSSRDGVHLNKYRMNLALQGDRTNQYACTYATKYILDELLAIQEDLARIQISYENLTLYN